ncbi:MAG TPA: segregation/condensation protein A [Candidatus Paceibacterota bacterium]|nr:segregation/condensation protein A [Candidatus Paceibacterota bacterium]
MEVTLGEAKVDFRIQTEHFEGPLDLLLSLIEKRKLFISDFSLSKVADDYISHVRSFESYPMSDVANFLLVASTLVLIKSKSILPDLNLTIEEEQDISDLKRRLALHELFRALSEVVKSEYGKRIIFEKSARTLPPQFFAPDAQMTPVGIHEGAIRVLEALPKKVALPKATIKKVVSIEEMMNRLAERVTGALKMGFSRFAKYERGKPISREERVDVIVSFLAMLELVKQGTITVAQSDDWGEIDIEPIELATPTYG